MNHVHQRYRATVTEDIEMGKCHALSACYRRRPHRTTCSTSILRLSSTDLLDVIRKQWLTIRTRMSRGPLQFRYDYKLKTLDTTVLEARWKKIFQEQTQSFNINLSYVFDLRNKNTGRYKYYHSSCNCCERYLDKSNLITNNEDVDEPSINQTGFGVGVVNS